MLTALIGPLAGLLDKFIEDKDEKNKLVHEIATMAEKAAHESRLAQLDVNKQEAMHRTVFVAGWRPFVGWVCGFALAYHFILSPLAIFVLAYMGKTAPDLPVFDMDTLLTVLLGMLGLGGLRTYEKHKGVSR